MVTPIMTSMMMMMGDGDDHDVGHDDDDYDGNGTCLPRSYPLCPAQWPIANDPLTPTNQLHISSTDMFYITIATNYIY